MKNVIKVFLCSCVVVSVFCSCAKTPYNEIVDTSSIRNNDIVDTSSIQSVTNVKESAGISDLNVNPSTLPTGFQNQMDGGNFFYHEEINEMIYHKAEEVNGVVEYSLVATDFKNERKISDDSASSITVYNGRIYYCTEDSIFSIKLDGTDKVKHASAETPYFLYVNNKGIFYRASDRIYCISTSGKQKVIETKLNVLNFTIYGDYIYYGGFTDERDAEFELYCYDMKTGHEQLIETMVSTFDAAYDKLFVMIDEKIYAMNLDGTNKKEIVSGACPFTFFIKDKSLLYYQDAETKYRLMEHDISSGKDKKICELEYAPWIMCGEYFCSYQFYREPKCIFKKIF